MCLRGAAGEGEMIETGAADLDRWTGQMYCNLSFFTCFLCS